MLKLSVDKNALLLDRVNHIECEVIECAGSSMQSHCIDILSSVRSHGLYPVRWCWTDHFTTLITNMPHNTLNSMWSIPLDYTSGPNRLECEYGDAAVTIIMLFKEK